MKPLSVLTFGCRLNAYESEVIKMHLAAAGLENVVVVNSCAVTDLAERQTRQAIRKARRENPDARLIVTGCAAEIHPEIFTAMSEVDAVISNADKLKAGTWDGIKNMSHPREGGDPAPSICEACESFTPQTRRSWIPAGACPVLRHGAGMTLSETAPPAPPIISSFEGLTRAFVPVQTGCNNTCTFCIIPQGRGHARSFAPEHIIAQVRKLITSCPEIVLTGVDIASFDASGLKLGGLVKRILKEVPELKRLRLSSLDPAALDDDLWDVIAHEERLMPCLHLSVQAGDDMILKRMKRRHTRQNLYDLAARARRLRPDIVFGADVIAGFPTETDAMFENTRCMFEELDFTWLHVFPFSASKGTPAAKMPQVKGEVRKKRAEILRNLGEKAVRNHLQGLVGQRLSLHVEGYRLGRTPSFAEVDLTSAPPVGTVIQADIVGVQGLRALAEVN